MKKLSERLEHYAEIADFLNRESCHICRMNDCTDEEHNCESGAYFDFKDGVWYLSDVSTPDYLTRGFDSSILLPFYGDVADLLQELEDNDLRPETCFELPHIDC